MDRMFIQCLLHANKNALLLHLNLGKAGARMIHHAAKKLHNCIYRLKFLINLTEIVSQLVVCVLSALQCFSLNKNECVARERVYERLEMNEMFKAKINTYFSTIKQIKW